MTYALSEPLQQAIYATLAADPALQSIVGGNIFDDPATVTTASGADVYITLGEEAVKSGGSATEHGAVHDFSVTVYSDQAGFKASKAAAAAVCDALLAADMALSRGHLTYLRFLKAKASVGPAPTRRKIALNFRAFVEDTST